MNSKSILTILQILKISHRGDQKVKMTVEKYVNYMKHQKDDVPLYVFDSDFGEKAPKLLEGRYPENPATTRIFLKIPKFPNNFYSNEKFSRSFLRTNFLNNFRKIL